jgi:hypothetical protein
MRIAVSSPGRRAEEGGVLGEADEEFAAGAP